MSYFKAIRFRQGLRPRPRWGSLRRSPRPSSQLGRGIPPPRLWRLGIGAFGVEISLSPALLFLTTATAIE